jgi:diguanylate cyclase (GGDEF)-like protein
MTISTLPGRIAAVMLGAIVVLVLASAVSILWMTQALDRQSRDHSASMVRTAFANVLGQTTLTALDYTKWIDAVGAIESLDRTWMNDNIGATALYGEVFQLGIYWGGPLPEDVGWTDDPAEQGVPGLLPQGTLDQAEAGLRKVPLGTSEGVGFWGWRGDELHALAASRVEWIVDGAPAEPLPDAEIARFLIGQRIDEGLLGGVADSTLLRDVTISRERPSSQLSLPLLGADGQAVAHVSWQTPLAGTRMLREMLPWLLLVGALATGLVLLAMVLTRRSAHQLVLAARTDALTGLPNRFAFGEVVAHPARAGERAILFLDLNGFKRINDDIGHAAGDLVIKWMAERLAPLTGPDCRVARIGGDEFVFVVTGADAGLRTADLARAVDRALAVPFVVQGHSLHLRAAMGYAVQTEDLVHGDDLVRQADLAMYEAKRHRSGPVAFGAMVDKPGREARDAHRAGVALA